MDIPEENQRLGGEFDELAFEIVEFKDLSTKAPLQATKAPLAVLSHDGFTSSLLALYFVTNRSKVQAWTKSHLLSSPFCRLPIWVGLGSAVLLVLAGLPLVCSPF